MEVSVFEAALGRFLGTDHSRPTLTFFGGEPLLEMPLVRLAVEIVRARKPKWMRPDLRLFTNGLLLDPKTADFLSEADIYVTLSIDGLPAAQDQRGPGTFAILDEVLVRLGRERPERFRERISVALTLTSGNVAYLAGSFRYFLSRGVRDIEIVPVVTNDRGWGAEARDELDRQLACVAEESRNVLATSGEVPFTPFRSDGRQTAAGADPVLLCDAGSRKALFVDVDGSTAPCAAMARSGLRNAPPLLREILDMYGEVLVTDANFESSLREREERIRALPLLRGKRAKISPMGLCRNCPALESCFVCPAAIAWNDSSSDPDRIPAIQCDFNWLIEQHREDFARPAGLIKA